MCERGKSESRSRVIEKEERDEHREYYIAKYSLLLFCDEMGEGEGR